MLAAFRVCPRHQSRRRYLPGPRHVFASQLRLQPLAPSWSSGSCRPPCSPIPPRFPSLSCSTLRGRPFLCLRRALCSSLRMVVSLCRPSLRLLLPNHRFVLPFCFSFRLPFRLPCSSLSRPRYGTPAHARTARLTTSPSTTHEASDLGIGYGMQLAIVFGTK